MPPEPSLIREELSALDQPELATLYAEHITSTSVLQAGPQPIPPNMRRTRKPQQASPPHYRCAQNISAEFIKCTSNHGRKLTVSPTLKTVLSARKPTPPVHTEGEKSCIRDS